MSAAIALGCVRGEAYEATGTHKTRAGALVNVTGWTIVFTMRKTLTSADPPVLQKTCSVISGPAGTYHLLLTSTETRALEALVYRCDFWRTDSGSEAQMARGGFTVKNGLFFL
jgi:hypothetical protein